MTDRGRWAIVTGILFALLAIVIWLVVVDAPIVKFLVRLYQDKKFLKETVRSWGWMAPLVFIAIQATQVIISPIPGESTGPPATESCSQPAAAVPIPVSASSVAGAPGAESL